MAKLILPEGSMPDSLILKAGEESSTFPIEILESVESENGNVYILYYYNLGVQLGKFELVEFTLCNDDL